MTKSLTPLHRSIRVSITLVTATIAAGLLVRFGPLGLPRCIVKYGGSILWALMIYWIVSALRPRWRALSAALLAGALATSVEFAKLYHSPSIDAFRLTILGMLLLGRVFSVGDILAYWLAMASGVILDRYIRRVDQPEALRVFGKRRLGVRSPSTIQTIKNAYLSGSSILVLTEDFYPSIDILLKPPPAATIRGVVLDARGKSVSGTQVSVPAYSDVATTNEMGTSLLPHITLRGKRSRYEPRRATSSQKYQ